MKFGADVHGLMKGQVTSVALSRRRFLKIAAATALAAPLIPGCVAVKRGPVGERTLSHGSSRLAHACVGVGGRGLTDLQGYLAHPGVEVVAICDVDTTHLRQAAALAPAARLYTDWREMLAKENKAVDSVGICIPDHMHFAVAYSAMRRGKHVFLQSPMCHDVAEVRVLTRFAAQTGVITQVAQDLDASVSLRQGLEWLKSGIIGEVVHAYICSSTWSGPQSTRLPGPRPDAAAPIPPGLDWEGWIGTAPARFFAPGIYHPALWRSWQDFGTGLPGELGPQMLAPLWKGLDLGPARTIHASVQESWFASPERRVETWPQSNHITWTFPAGDLVAGRELAVEWFDGEFQPPERVRSLYSEINASGFPQEGTLVVGTRGAVLIPQNGAPSLLPRQRFAEVKLPVVQVFDPYQRFFDACLGQTTVESDFKGAGPLHEAALLAGVAVRFPEQTLKWDHEQMRFLENPEADGFLRRRYRQRWHVGPF